MNPLASWLVSLTIVCAASLFAAGDKPANTDGIKPDSFQSDFKSASGIPAGWHVEGDISIDTADAFTGDGHSLKLRRTLENSSKPTFAVSPSIRVVPGIWNVGVACKSDLASADNSFRALVAIECLDPTGKLVDQLTLADIYGKKPWEATTQRMEIPAGVSSIRYKIELQKTWGTFLVDALSAAFSGPAQHEGGIDRLYFSNKNLGHFLYPDDPRVFKVTVEATKPLPAAQLEVHCTLTDYWGAEQSEPVIVSLTQVKEPRNGRIVYEGNASFDSVPLEVGKYYEIHGEIPRANEPAYQDHSSFVIELEAAANAYKAVEIPFTGRNWDGRVPETFEIAHRLGFRVMNIWSRSESQPPYNVSAPCIDIAEKYGMGAIFGMPSASIETHAEGWDKYNETALRGGVRNMIQTYRKQAEPFIIDLGNEPPVLADRIPEMVNAYRIIYDEAKKTDPSVFVLGTSIGATDDFFKAGFGKYLDAYDFHIYEDPQNVALTLQKYKDLFKKYGNPKPIWSTELGLNSQGMPRSLVAADMIKKLALFFANGGANVSWFDLFYPDPDAKIAGGSGESHDTFDSRYVQYAPKVTAVTYYELINSIAIKKFVAEKQYGKDIHAYLFRDRDNRQLFILWKDKGSENVFLPLPGIKGAQVIRIADSHRNLSADAKGVTVTIGEDPILLLCDGTSTLPETLGEPAAMVASVPTIVRGASTDIEITHSEMPAGEIGLIAPPFWKVTKSPTSAGVKLTVSCPDSTTARAADLVVTLGSEGNLRGEIFLRPSITGQISAQTLPAPGFQGQPPGVKVVLQNNDSKKQDVSWELLLVKQLPLIDGEYKTSGPADAHFSESPRGTVTLEAGASKEVIVPLAGIDSQAVYRVRTTVSDAAGRASVQERYLAGFIPVPKATSEVKIDGALDSPDWKRAPVEKLDEQRQYFSFDPATTKWKGPKDLSATLRFLWDDHALYVGVEVTDDLPGGLQQDDMLWAQDGLQFLIDPCRAMAVSTGKYDYSMAVGKKGPQTWCSLSADAAAPNGDAKDILLGIKRKNDNTASMTYVVAIPWHRVAPFKPAAGANFGLSMIVNDDDGQGRKSFISWFGGTSNKDVDLVGDLILMP